MSFHVGQRVVCISDSPSFTTPPWPVSPHLATQLHGLRKGVVYTVRAVVEYRGVEVVHLYEIKRLAYPAKYGEPGFSPKRFRPIDETRLDQFRAHLAPTPKTPVTA